MNKEDPIFVTSPLLPELDNFIPLLKDIWKSKWLTNNGSYHQKLEKELSKFLGIEYLSLFTNGTLPLLTALQALRISGEVITSPYSFVATTHSLWWNGIKPVFVDVEPNSGNMNPEKIEAAISPKTTAIMPVHVYGNPCKVNEIQEIANKYGLKVIYDAAHAFAVKINNRSILEYGDMSTLSFHATKVYSTIEGGALVSNNAEAKKRIDYLKNFGFADEVTVVAPGINAKLDEVRSAFGLITLDLVNDAIKKRKEIVDCYKEGLADVKGLRFFPEQKEVDYNYAYFPVFIKAEEYKMSRDALYELLKTHNIYGRRYFYPLISSFSTYKDLDSAKLSNLPVANMLANEVLCLPIYADLKLDDVKRIINIIKSKK